MARTTDKPPCAGMIHEDYGAGFRGCTRAGIVEEDGKWWCRQHLPSAVKAKAAARNAVFRAEYETAAAARDEGRGLRNALESLGVVTIGTTHSPVAKLGAPDDRITISYAAARALIARLSSTEETSV